MNKPLSKRTVFLLIASACALGSVILVLMSQDRYGDTYSERQRNIWND